MHAILTWHRVLFIILQPGTFYSPDEYEEDFMVKFPHAREPPRNKKIRNKEKKKKNKRKEEDRKKEGKKEKENKETEEFYVL